jgi:hypothetical protein
MKFNSLNGIILPIIVTIISTSACYAQNFVWNTGFNGFFDNREYFNKYIEPQTMFGSRIFGFAGLTINEQQEFGVGLDFLYEFGGNVNSNSFAPLLYYHFENKLVNLFLGAFPRKYLADFPIVLQTDTIDYYRPNIEGIFVEFRKPWGSHNFWIDWTSRQTDTERETFQIQGTGKLQKGLFFYRHDLLLVHLAGPAVDIPGDHIRDQGGVYARIGLNLSSKSFFDSLSISTGYAMSYDRLRNVYDLKLYNGSLSEIVLEYRNFGVKNTLYFGNGQAPGIGEAVYEASFYNRTDLYWIVFKAVGVDARIEFSFHLIEDVLDFSQKFTVYAKLDGKKKIMRQPKN